jgi:hypothetical protein
MKREVEQVDDIMKNAAPDAGLGERLVREMLRTPPLKELVLLMIKDIDPDGAKGLASALLWEDPVVFMSMIGALPDVINWLLEFVAELGRQFNVMPAHLLADFVKVIEGQIRLDTLKELPVVYGGLLQKIFFEDGHVADQAAELTFEALNLGLKKLDELTPETDAGRERIASALAGGIDRLDTRALGSLLGKAIKLANETRKRRSAKGGKLKAVLAEIDAGEVASFTFAIVRGSVKAVFQFAARCLRGLINAG